MDSASGTISPPQDGAEIRRLANAIRALSMDAVEAAKSGHPGMPMGMADVATVLFAKFLKFDASAPKWQDRDRFVLSAGHGSMLLYSLLWLTGYSDISIEDIKRFRQLGSPCAGHPEYGHLAGIETTTGPLGQGIATAVGMALGEKLDEARFGPELVDHKTYVIAGDGDLMEGISQEALTLAGHLKLSKLIVLYDDNNISIDGDTGLADSTNASQRFEASGWATYQVDGHNPDEVAKALEAAQKSDKPSLICCRTKIGFGAPTRAGTAKAHGEPLGAEEIAGARQALNWTAEPFLVPGPILSDWRSIGRRGEAARLAWDARKAASAQAAAFDAAHSLDLPASFAPAIQKLKAKFSSEAPSLATRKSSELVLEVVNAEIPNTIGGSADLTGSNNTKTKGMKEVTPSDFSGRYMHYGIREHGMAAAMNGLAQHRGSIPYGGTFLIFSDYCKPAIRLSALSGLRVVYVMTHDSIGLGEDGPTHQPVEQLPGLRAIPNLLTFRPADAVETAEAWQLAMENGTRPSLLALTRQNLPTLRTTHTDENLSAKGGYELAAATGEAKVSIFATGSEVEIAMQARDLLQAEGIGTRVVSLPCWTLFEEQDAQYQSHVLGTAPVKLAIEAASPLGWARYIGPDGIFIGMHGFGASAPYKDAYRHFGLTPEAAAEAARAALKV